MSRLSDQFPTATNPAARVKDPAELEPQIAYGVAVTVSSLVQNAHFVAASGTLDWQYGQVFVGGGGP
jgi:hypothetical protein